MAVVMTNSANDTKRMETGEPHTTYHDITRHHIDETVEDKGREGFGRGIGLADTLKFFTYRTTSRSLVYPVRDNLGLLLESGTCIKDTRQPFISM